MTYAVRLTRIAVPALIVLGACGPPAVTPSDPPPSRTLTATDLANATYEGIYDAPVQLINGRFEGEPFQPGAASRPTLTLLWNTVVFGDLDGDGADEGVALLVESSGGSGSFIYLAVISAVERDAKNLSTILVGDRIKVSDLEIAGGAVKANVVVAGPGEPMSEPGQSMFRRWELKDGNLIETTTAASSEPA